jgi:hypothetical protein
MITNPYDGVKETGDVVADVQTTKTEGVIKGKGAGDTVKGDKKKKKKEDGLQEINKIPTEHEGDETLIPFKNLKVVGSVSEYCTRLLNDKLDKVKRLAPEERIIVIVDDKKSMDNVPIIRANTKKKITVWHNNPKHLPMYDRSLESYCEANDIILVLSVDELIIELTTGV